MVLFGLTQALGGGQSAVDPFGEVDRRLSVEQRHPADLLQARPHELGRIGAPRQRLLRWPDRKRRPGAGSALVARRRSMMLSLETPAEFIPGKASGQNPTR